MTVADARQTDLTIFHQLYEPLGNLGDPCAYCGVVSSGWDHVPPLHFVSRLSYEARRHYWLRLLPACRECNSWLGGIIKTTAADRRIHVRRHLRKKYARLLSIPEWDEVELNHLSEKLQHDIRSKLRAAAFIRQRIGFHGSTRIFEYS